MDSTSLRLELVPMDEAANSKKAASAPEAESSTTTRTVEAATAAADLALAPLDLAPGAGSAPAAASSAPEQDSAASPVAPSDTIEIPPVARLAPKLGDTQSIDIFVAQALREYASGNLDQPSWERALAQVNGDAAAAETVYVRMRAGALKAVDRQRREARRAVLEAPEPPPFVEPPSLWQRYKIAIVAAAVIVPVAIAGAVFLKAGDDESAPPERVAARSPRAPSAAPATAPPPAEKAAQTNEALAKKVQELRDVGNFNVMVLYAVEWTRKEPDNVAAWDALRAGYVHLRQYEDARSAANKAVQLKPDDARMWRNLASVNMDVDDPEGALAAYEQAVARNSVDVDSLQAIALLNARLGRLAEAKSAFDRAAAASPGDPITACLRNGVAQMQPTRDAYTMSRQVHAIDNRCHGRPDAVAAAR